MRRRFWIWSIVTTSKMTIGQLMQSPNRLWEEGETENEYGQISKSLV